MRDLSSAERYRLLADSALEHALIITDNDGLIMEWSAGAQALLGWSQQEAEGQPISMIYTEEDRQAGSDLAELAAARAQGRSSDVRWHLRNDGSTVFCDGIVSSIAAADGVTILGYGKVMRAAHTARSASTDGEPATEQRSFVAALLESVESGIAVCDRQGKLTFFNQVARDIHGLREEPIACEKWAEHYRLFQPDGISPLPFNEVPLYRALKGELVQHARVAVITSTGVLRQLEVSGRPVLDGDGKVLGAVVSMHDVSAASEASAAQKRAEQSHARQLLAEESEASLRKAKEQLNLATEAAQLGIWTWNPLDGIGTWENARMAEIFGDCAGGKDPRSDLRSCLSVEHGDELARALEDTWNSGKRFCLTAQFYRQGSAEPRWVELTGMRHMQTSATSIIVIGTAADITERKSNEEALKRATLRFEATLAAGEVASWIWNIKDNQVTGDKNLARLFGVPDELASAAPLAAYTDSIHPGDRRHVEAEIERAIGQRDFYSATYRVIGVDDEFRWVIARGRAVLDNAGEPELLVGVTLDITRQKQAQEALRATEERYRTVISSMDEAFGIIQIQLDDCGHPVDYLIEEANGAFEVQSGLVAPVGKTIRELVPDIETHWIETYGSVALKREPIRFIERSITLGYWWDVYAAPIGHPQDLRVALLFADVTAKKKAEDDLRQVAADLSESNRRKTEFLATLAHELRNPLAPVRSGLDLLYEAGSDETRRTKVLAVMDRQLKHVVRLIDDLMDISRINNGKVALKKSHVELKTLVAHALDSVQPALNSARHQLEVRLPESAITLDVDATRIVQVLANLLANAIKYTPPGGHIALAAEATDHLLQVSVRDDGIGIPAADLPRVFDMFSQVDRNLGHSQGGLGIGLALVHRLVEMHGGTVNVASPGPGRGTTFTVELPTATMAFTSRQAGQRERMETSEHFTIVIADDNKDAAEVLSRLLQLAGHTTHVAHDGGAALQCIQQVGPDVALLDIGMPRLNGYEVAGAVRQLYRSDQVLLIALSGWGDEQHRLHAETSGFDAHLTKPVAVADILELILRLRRALRDGAADVG